MGKIKNEERSTVNVLMFSHARSNLYGTRITASLAAMVRISAQETIPGHSDSSLFLILSMIPKPFNEFMLGEAFFSPCNVIVSSSRIDPSHPCGNCTQMLAMHAILATLSSFQNCYSYKLAIIL